MHDIYHLSILLLCAHAYTAQLLLSSSPPVLMCERDESMKQELLVEVPFASGSTLVISGLGLIRTGRRLGCKLVARVL